MQVCGGNAAMLAEFAEYFEGDLADGEAQCRGAVWMAAGAV